MSNLNKIVLPFEEEGDEVFDLEYFNNRSETKPKGPEVKEEETLEEPTLPHLPEEFLERIENATKVDSSSITE